MESDDDYASFSPPILTPSPVHHRRLRRLKKSINPSPIKSTEKTQNSIEDLLPIPRVDFAKLEALEASKTVDFEEDSDGLLLFPKSIDPSPIRSTEKTQTSIDDLLPIPPVDFAKLEALEASKTVEFEEDSDGLLLFPNVDFAKLEALEAGKILDSEGFNETELDSEFSEEFSKDLRSDELNGGLSEEGNGIDNDSGFLDGENDVGTLGEKRKETKRTLDFDEPANEVEVEGNVEKPAKKQSKEGDLDEETGEMMEKKKTKKKRSKRKGNGINKDLSFLGEESDMNMFGKKHKEAKRVLEFDDAVNEVEEEGDEKENADLEMEKPVKKRSEKGDSGVENSERTEKKKKRRKSDDSDDNGEPKEPVVNKRKEEKERAAYLKQLHAESQRVLRESRDAAFRPIPVVHKPISSLLEKIRQRKLEVLKKTTMLSNGYVSEETRALNEVMMDLDSDDVHIEEIEIQKSLKRVEDERVERGMDVESSSVASPMDGSKETATCTSHEKIPTQTVPDKESTPAFRAPVEDTQDLFGDCQESNSKDEDTQMDSPPEEAFAPSLLAMKLKFDSAPPDDSSSEEEDNDKENINPHLHKDHDDCTSPKGDPVRAFVDEEAEEEDDSDNDMGFLKENEEDDDIDDLEELNDMIATAYEEKPIDNDKRNELHQKWLEQQDAAGTDNLMQRLKYGSKYKEPTLLNEERTDDEDEEDVDDEVENEVPRNTSRMNSKRAKQMIAQMFLDNDNGYSSDEDKDLKERPTKQRLLVRSEERLKLVSLAEDESSREVFGLIKKLNIAPDNKKKPKASSFFDTMLKGSTDSSSKTSFLGRVSNNPLPSSNKQGGSVVKAFVFGRDDSNSRGSTSMSEDSSDTVLQEDRPSKSTTAKFSGSQVRSSSQRSSSAGETTAGSSLLDLLKRSSKLPSLCNQSNTIDLSQSVFNAFKIPKKPVKIDGRS